jgi:hypothetical protein
VGIVTVPITRQELTAALNQAASKNGLPLFTERAIRHLVDQHILPKAIAHGVQRGENPEWRYPDHALELIEPIVELKRHGAKSADELIVGMAILVEAYEFDRVKRALTRLLRKLVKRQQRQLTGWQYDHRHDDDAKREKSKKRNGQLAPVLSTLPFRVSEDSALDVVSRLQWGQADGKEPTISDIFKNELAKVIPLANDLPKLAFEFADAAAMFEGYEEEAVPAKIEQVTEEDFLEARTIIQQMILGLTFGAAFLLAKDSDLTSGDATAAESMLTPDWLIMNVSIFAVAALNRRTDGR